MRENISPSRGKRENASACDKAIVWWDCRDFFFNFECIRQSNREKRRGKYCTTPICVNMANHMQSFLLFAPFFIYSQNSISKIFSMCKLLGMNLLINSFYSFIWTHIFDKIFFGYFSSSLATSCCTTRQINRIDAELEIALVVEKNFYLFFNLMLLLACFCFHASLQLIWNSSLQTREISWRIYRWQFVVYLAACDLRF